MAAELPEQLLALPLSYLDVSESLFLGPHLAAALPRLTRLTSLALDKCELGEALRGAGGACRPHASPGGCFKLQPLPPATGRRGGPARRTTRKLGR